MKCLKTYIKRPMILCLQTIIKTNSKNKIQCDNVIETFWKCDWDFMTINHHHIQTKLIFDKILSYYTNNIIIEPTNKFCRALDYMGFVNSLAQNMDPWRLSMLLLHYKKHLFFDLKLLNNISIQHKWALTTNKNVNRNLNNGMLLNNKN